MLAVTAAPGVPGSLDLSTVPAPPSADGEPLVETLAIGICGTDIEIVSGRYGWAPAGRERLIIGHEVLGRVREAPTGSGFAAGDLIVGIVRRPDPVPCRYCATGEWDMCRNGLYTERGIKQRDGYASQLFRIEADFAVKVEPALGALGVLVEPASIVAKAWDHACRIGRRSANWTPRKVLVTGAGPIGLFAALFGRQRGLEVEVFDRVTDGPKPALVRALGATYLHGELSAVADLAPDIVFECTGATAVIGEVVTRTAAAGIVCLAGISSGGHTVALDLGDISRRIVLENDTLFGSVNANRSHYQIAARALAAANPRWLSCLITRRVPLPSWAAAFIRERDDIKVVLDFEQP